MQDIVISSTPPSCPNKAGLNIRLSVCPKIFFPISMNIGMQIEAGE